MTCTIIINNSIILSATGYCRIVGIALAWNELKEGKRICAQYEFNLLNSKERPGQFTSRRNQGNESKRAKGERNSFVRDCRRRVASASYNFLNTIDPVSIPLLLSLFLASSQPDLIRDFKVRRPRIFSQVQVRRVCGTLYFNHSGLWIDQSLSFSLSLSLSWYNH